MKTTHEKLLISLLALGLTSSAGLYAQTASTVNFPGGNFSGLFISTPINEDFDLDGNFDIGEDANNDGLLNNGGTGAPLVAGGPATLIAGVEGALLNEFTDQVDYDGDGFIQNTAALGLANLFNEDLDGDNNLDLNEDLDGDTRLDIVNEDRNNNGLLANGGTGAPLVAGGPATLIAGVEEALLSEVGDNIDYNNDGTIAGFFNEDLDGDANLDLGLEDIDGDGVLDARNEDSQQDRTFQRHEDLDGDNNLDNVNEDLNGNNLLANGGTGAPLVAGGPATLIAGVEENLINEDLNGDGVLDQGEDLNGDGILNNGGTGPVVNGVVTFLPGEGALINEDLDNDGRLDAGNEDANGNGVLDANRNVTLMEAVNPIANADGTFNRQDLDILVANDVFINGQAVATENYVDAQDNVLRTEFAAADALLQAQITTNAGDIFTNSRGIAKNRRDIESNTRGIAMVAALQNQTVLPGMTQALDLSAAHFEGETGMAINYSRRINENVQINFGAATTSDGDENVVKAGIGWQW